MGKTESKVIWYCHHYAGAPSRGMSYRPYYLTREFCQLGHQAYIIGASYHHLLHSTQDVKEPVHLEMVDGVPFITLKVNHYVGNGIGRVQNMLGYASRFKKHVGDLVSLTGKPHVIIVSSAHPFHYRILEKYSRQFKAKLIFEVRDLWPLSLQQLLNMPRWNPLILWLASIERRAYRNADCVVSVLQEAFSYMKTRGLTYDRFQVIPNGTNIQEFQNECSLSQDLEQWLQSLKVQGKFLLGYAGAMGKPNALQYLIQAMALISRTNSSIHCVLVGDGHLKNELNQQVVQLGLTNITFLPAIKKPEVPAFLKHMDALYLGWNEVDIYRYGVSPNKLFDYMMAAKPIIESGGEEQSIIEKVGCGLQCRAEDSETIAKLIIKISKFSEIEKNNMGLRGQSAVHELYNYKILAEKYIKLF